MLYVLWVVTTINRWISFHKELPSCFLFPSHLVWFSLTQSLKTLNEKPFDWFGRRGNGSDRIFFCLQQKNWVVHASGKLTSRLSITFITLFVHYFCFSILFLDRAIGWLDAYKWDWTMVKNAAKLAGYCRGNSWWVLAWKMRKHKAGQGFS